MDNASLTKLVFGLQATGFLALIGVYVWSFRLSMNTDKKIAKIYDMMNKHHENSSIHQDDSAFVRKEVCETVTKQMSRDVTEIKKDVKELIKKAG